MIKLICDGNNDVYAPPWVDVWPMDREHTIEFAGMRSGVPEGWHKVGTLSVEALRNSHDLDIVVTDGRP